jgi:hypothetical protein
MEKIARLISVVVIAIALMIAFSGVASASWLAEYTQENKTFNSPIGYDRTMTGDHGFEFWKSSSSKNLLDNPTFAFGKREVYRNVNFNKNFDIYSGTGYTPRLGSLPITPASSDEMTAYSKLAVTDVQATTRAEVGMTDNPVLNYKINAEGSNDGSMAKGRISAGMSVYVAGDPILSYEERSSASGSFQFHKAMDYTSKITTP